MWSNDAVLPIESNNNICADSLISSLVEGGGATTASPTDQQSNSSSLESLDSPLLDDNRAISTSCSEDSFEMSSTASRNAGDLPTPSDSLRFCTDSLKHSFDHQLESDSETKSGLKLNPEMKQLPQEEAFKEPRSDQPERVDNLIQCIECKSKPTSMAVQNGTDSEPKSFQAVDTTSNGHRDPEDESSDATNNRDEWEINLKSEDGEVSQVNELIHKESNGENMISSTTSGSVSDGSRLSAIYDHQEDHPCRPPSTSKSMGSIGSTLSSKEALQKSIDAEVKSLDTCLPELDFNKLEEQLNCAAKERQIIERKLLGEQVRRRLALQVDQLTAGPSPRILTRPSRSNLGFRLQTAMNLQVCYMNDMDDDEDEDDDSSDDDFNVPKSKSAPNLRGQIPDGSNMNATQLRQQIASNECSERRIVLEEETRLLLEKAKETAKMQMELEKLYAPRGKANPRKVTRVQLSKMTCRQLMEIYNQLSKRIDEENAELMRLLVERDSLHMQQDSMLVDIEDMIRHESNSECLNLPEFLKVQASTPSKFRIFKR